MHKITCHDPALLTGQVGSVVFVKGEGQTDAEHMLEFFLANPDRFEVEAIEPDPEQSDETPDENDQPPAGDQAPAPQNPAPEPDEFEGMNVEALRKAASTAGLPTAGSKAELQARLREHAEAAKSNPQE